MTKIGRIIILLLASIVTMSGRAATPTLLTKVDQTKANRWVDSVYNQMTQTQRIAQLFFPTVDPKKETESKIYVKRLVGDNQVGGLLFSEGSIMQFANLTNHAQSLAKVPLMMTLDGEWGLSMRIDNTPRFPHNMGLGAIANETLLYLYGKEVARQCRLMGIHVNFAPVLDVNCNPSNPVIGYRSFGENPQRVGALGAAYSKGLEDGGVMAVGKHYPGHGDTETDSHKALPTLDHSIKDLQTTDLIPFERFINGGYGGVMVGHLSVPSLDRSGTPASLSNEITTGWLKKKMGFNGIVFTDALAMKGAVSKHNKCVAALLAGADALLGSDTPINDIKAVEKAVKSGLIPAKTIEQSCKKILRFKYALGLSNKQSIATSGLEKKINAPSANDICQRLANGSITVIHNNNNLLPLRGLGKRSIAVVNIGEDKDYTFTRYCAKYTKIDQYSTAGSFSAGTLADIKRHDVVIVGVHNDRAASRNAFAQLKGVSNIIPVFFVNPYKMAKFRQSLSGIKTLMIAYDNTPHTRIAAAQAVFGGIPVTGRLPVNLNGIAKMGTGVIYDKVRLGYSSPEAEGMDDGLIDKIDNLAAEGIKTKAFPGCQVMVVKNGNVVVDKSYGYLDYTKQQKVTDRTLYDLASVSKATGTLSGIMAAYDKGLLALDEPASTYIPRLVDTNKEDITIRQLLYHETGMPPIISVFAAMMDSTSYSGKLITAQQKSPNTIKISNGAYGHKSAKLRTDILSTHKSKEFPHAAAKGIYIGQEGIDTIMNRIYNAKLRPSKAYNYSCLNFALLMDVEQNVTKTPHDKWVGENIFAPLGMNRTCYRPTTKFKLTEIAPTEKDVFMRKQTMHGYAHDELAGMSGGVQGNAGLFANANDLAKLCQMYLNNGKYGGETIIGESTVKLFTTNKSPRSHRGLGFDKPNKKNQKASSTARQAPTSTFGHTGYTGTCFWVDPDNELIFIFLCNRVHPTRDNPAYSKLSIRSKIQEQIYRSLKKNDKKETA